MTLTPQLAVMTASRQTLQGDPWCVYEHWLHDELIYIGFATIADAFRLTHARNNSEWVRIVSPETVINVRVIMIGPRMDCARDAAGRIAMQRPRCNVMGHTLYAARAIACSDGRVFGSQTEAARALGVSDAAISLYFSRGDQQIKGVTLSKIG